MALPKSGTISPTRRVPNRVDETPTIQGSNPPPMLERTNITDPTRVEENSLESSAIVIG